LLPHFFGEVHAPEAVVTELKAGGAPESVRIWARNPPPWLKVHSNLSVPPQLAAAHRIDAGEREALALALSMEATLVIVDDRAARQTAEVLGFAIVGTLGLLERAASEGLLDFEDSVAQLLASGFWIRESVIEEMRARLRNAKP
jgi:predicted nucleic acid-binding protein